MKPYKKSEVIDANIGAIKTLLSLGPNNLPSQAERENLLDWRSWGGCSEIFMQNNASTTFYRERSKLLRSLVTDKQWNQAMKTTLNAHYTHPLVAKGMWSFVDKLLPNGGKALEIGCGSGTFIETKPNETWNFEGVEIDEITAKIAQKLHPNDLIHNSRIEDLNLEDGTFDLVIGNVPFSSIAPYDKKYNSIGAPLHDYCLMRGIHALKSGGVMAVITSIYSLDKSSIKIRRWLNDNADLLYAYRLPEKAHSESAGTSVVTDFLIFRKKDQPKASPVENSINFLQSHQCRLRSNNYRQHGNRVLVKINEAFLAPTSLNPRDLADIFKFIYDDQKNIVLDVSSNLLDEFEIRAGILGTSTAGGPYSENDHSVNYHYSKSQYLGQILEFMSKSLIKAPLSLPVTSAPLVKNPKENFKLEKIKIPVGGENEYNLLVELKNYVKAVLSAQEDEPLRKQLAKELLDTYNKYLATYGRIERKRSGLDKKVWEAFQRDFEWAFVGSLEIYDDISDEVHLSKIFFEKIISKADYSNISTIEEAVRASLQHKLSIDEDFIAGLLHLNETQTKVELEKVAFIDPITKEWVLNNIYLSGDVISKLDLAKTIAENNQYFERNVSALNNVLPKPISPEDIEFRLGAPWINESYIMQFISSELNCQVTSGVSFQPGVGWSVKVPNFASSYTHSKYYGLGRTFSKLMAETLNSSPAKVYDVIDGKRVLNETSTLAVREAMETLREDFRNWITEDSVRLQELTDTYNNLYNRTVPTVWNGDYLDHVEEMSNEFKLRDHQKACIDRILHSGNTLVAHPVGAGKTGVFSTVAILGKRNGLFNKPLIVVPNLAVENFSNEFKRMFPHAKLLTYGQSSEKISRQEFVAMAASNDWDAIIAPISVFERIPLSEDTLAAFIEDKTSTLRNYLNDLTQQDAPEKNTIKKIEKKIEALVQKLKKLTDSTKDRHVYTFENMGVDCILIDEIQEWKNLPIISGMEYINSTGSKRSVDLDSKLAWLRSKSNSKLFVCGATGTHVSNAVWELWVLWNYIDRDSLTRYGFDRFDSWVSEFAEIKTTLEVKADGYTWEPKTRISSYTNVQTLMRLVSQWADLLTDYELDLPKPTQKGNKPINIVLPSTPELTEYTKSLTQRIEDISRKIVTPSEDNMLKVCSDGRKASLDLRLLDEYQDRQLSKIHRSGEEIYRIYSENIDVAFNRANGERSNLTGVLQLVFADLGVPKDNDWNVYSALKSELVNRGIPAEKIQFIHSYSTPVLKNKLLKLANDGEISVLIGSTQKMGTALNIQTRLKAVHHIDPPWRPSDIKQRDGRCLRQGNQNEEVEIYRYMTEMSFDIFYWQTLERKNRFIAQVSSSNPDANVIEEISIESMNYTESKALATGDTRLIDLAKIEVELKKAKSRQKTFTSKMRRIEVDIRNNDATVNIYNRRIKDLKILKAHLENCESQFTKEEIAENISRINKKIITDHENMSSGLKDFYNLVLKCQQERDSSYQYTGNYVLIYDGYARAVKSVSDTGIHSMQSLGSLNLDIPKIVLSSEELEKGTTRPYTRLLNKLQDEVGKIEIYTQGVENLTNQTKELTEMLSESHDLTTINNLTLRKEELESEIYGSMHAVTS